MEKAKIFTDMAFIESREKSFKKWPFNKGPCTPRELAKAGFFMPSKNYLSLQCYYCFKEMEGWEDTDDPLEEHKKHAPYCSYASAFDKSPESLTKAQVTFFELDRMCRKKELMMEKQHADYDHLVDKIVDCVNLPPSKRQRRKKN